MAVSLTSDKINVETTAGPKKRLLDVCSREGLPLNSRCGGKASCGGCTLVLREGEYISLGRMISLAPGDKERKVLGCQTRCLSEDALIYIPAPSRLELTGKIADDFQVRAFRPDSGTRRYVLNVPEADMEDQRADQLRLEEVLSRVAGVDRVHFPLECLRQLPGALQDGGGKVTVTLGMLRNTPCILDVRAGETTGILPGVAFDIGTTTVVGVLVDLLTGTVLGRSSRYNQQITIADDVSARISWSTSPAKLKRMQKLLVEETLNPIIGELCDEAGIEAGSIAHSVVSGNTVMIHLLLAMDPTTIGRMPFHPVAADPGGFWAMETGLDMMPRGIVDVVPAIAGYVGGDIVADIHATGIRPADGLTLMVDIGTNGEMVMTDGDGMVACATPAGPAFEGGRTRSGMRAAPGAIERIRFGRELRFELGVIGDVRPTGICGSALIDFIAEGMRCGLINNAGRFDLDMLRAGGAWVGVEEGDNQVHACRLVPAGDGLQEPIVITELDMSELLQAKSAIYSGLKTLLATAGRTFRQVDRFVLTGGFARYIDIENGIFCGLLPELDRARIEVPGNGSLAGAYMTLMDRSALDSMRDMVGRTRVIELNMAEDFEQNFIEALFLPNYDEDDFPGVIAELEQGEQDAVVR